MRTFRTTAVATTALCALLSACAAEKPQYPVAEPAPAPAPPPPPAQPPVAPPVAVDPDAPTAAPTKPVTAAPLAPPPGARETTAPARRTPSAERLGPMSRPPRALPVVDPVVQKAQAEARSEAAMAAVLQKALGSGPVRSESGKSVTAKRGETVATLARRTGVDAADIERETGLKRTSKLKRGQVIRLPATRYYVVQNGDTLYSISRRFGLDAETLATFNKSKTSIALHNGQKLYLPADALDKGVPKPIPVTAPPPAAAPSAAPPPVEAAAPPAPAPSPPAVVATAPPPPAPPAPSGSATSAGPVANADDSEAVVAGRGLFLWPVKGELIQKFGPSGASRNDGIDLGATKGDAVRSAAAGEVVYAGNAVQGFGNLVLIKHDGGWVTAYAHLANIAVKMRQQVTQGQELGMVGQTGGVDRPELHFEVRYAPSPSDKARPIDPMLVLPVG